MFVGKIVVRVGGKRLRNLFLKIKKVKIKDFSLKFKIVSYKRLMSSSCKI